MYDLDSLAWATTLWNIFGFVIINYDCLKCAFASSLTLTWLEHGVPENQKR